MGGLPQPSRLDILKLMTTDVQKQLAEAVEEALAPRRRHLVERDPEYRALKKLEEIHWG